MFVDSARVTVKAGNGGNGYVSFRKEKYIAKGGPEGGDGGNGGNVIFEASWNQNTLSQFRFQKELKAAPGEDGFKKRMHGKNGADLIVPVPVGTMVIDSEGRLRADLSQDGQRALIAKGGKGGFGNAHFVSSTRQAPMFAEKGERGDALDLTLELKMIADVGLIGLPNAGKSTLLSVISNARPEIANYPFTTIKPNLGVVHIDDSDFLVADIPGLIEGASEGKGLGDEFLKHVERTALLVHLIDVYGNETTKDFKTIMDELKAYRIDLSSKPQIVALSKTEGVLKELIDEKIKQIKKLVPKGTKIMAFSAVSKDGLKELLREIAKEVAINRAKAVEEGPEATPAMPIYKLEDEDAKAWTVEQRGDIWLVKGRKIERFAERTHFNSSQGEQRLRDIMRKMGILHELRRRGVEPGSKIHIGDPTIGSIEY